MRSSQITCRRIRAPFDEDICGIAVSAAELDPASIHHIKRRAREPKAFADIYAFNPMALFVAVNPPHQNAAKCEVDSRTPGDVNTT